MANKSKGTGLYAALSVCLLAAAAGGFFLLPQEDAPTAPETPVPQIVSHAPGQSVPQEEAPPQTALPDPQAQPETMPDPQERSAPAAAVIAQVAEPQAGEAPAEEPVEEPVEAVAPSLVVEPLRGAVITAFSVDALLYNETLEDWRIHDGIDICADAGTAVLAASAGSVLSVEDDALMGTTVILDHGDGCQTTYANLQAQPPVQKGDTVRAGQVIGAVGSTAAAEAGCGPHLHFSVSRNGDLIDPAEYLGR